VSVYVPEEFTDAESDILRRYFTNLDLPVFALVNLPEVVKGALFARYSRSPRSLRRLFLDEFVRRVVVGSSRRGFPRWRNGLVWECVSIQARIANADDLCRARRCGLLRRRRGRGRGLSRAA
jgi:hypothetical protein